ncbi:hypothetical protein LEP1GSC058_1349 [Leptospira fainei serovar Hurstbridge str. BUT 6]|uniref:Uncharacterized protein n=1 Tax=Leptospira fainei serovar Hurstbridge str. BUT 6 TaxID=1193011 RepID=S3W8D3_9LEPT|nr:hypothetical protein LEP1GSC058_1349 [Leptospira fainei serovar Hurstbridge str. BUT 6]
MNKERRLYLGMATFASGTIHRFGFVGFLSTNGFRRLNLLIPLLRLTQRV